MFTTASSAIRSCRATGSNEGEAMNAPIAVKRRTSPEALAGVLGDLKSNFRERAVDNASIREQHGHGEGLADSALPDLVVFAHTTDEVARIVRAGFDPRMNVAIWRESGLEPA